jgi:osmoprotectant transport system substrate-binding protein
MAVDHDLVRSFPWAGAGPSGHGKLGIGLALIGVILASSCSHPNRVIIGAKNFTESDLLAEIAAQQIERRTGLTVERKLHLGGTFVCHSAITAGQIDLYVEYTGTAYTAVLKHTAGPGADSVRRTVAREYRQRWDLVWLEPFGFNNTFAIAVRQADAERLGLHTISDLARVAPQWHAGFGYEFLNRADGFPGLAAAYGLHFAAPPTAMDLGLTYRALADGKIDVIAGNSTDGQLAALHLVALVDDRHYFPPYEAAPVVRNALLAQHPEVGRALLELRGKIDDDEMRRLNAMADVEHKDLHAIAHDWLARVLP